MSRLRSVILVGVALCAGFASRADEQVLFDFGYGFDARGVEVRSVVLGKGRNLLRLLSKHDQDWPGITLKAPNGKWDLSRRDAIEMDVRNLGSRAATVCLRVDNPGADGSKNCVTGRVELAPGARGALTVPFKRASVGSSAIKLWSMRGTPFGGGAAGGIDPSNVTQLIVFVPKPKHDQFFEISNIRATGTHVPAPRMGLDEFFPFIDKFGQYIHRDWPGKTHSLDELKRRAAEEKRELARSRGPKRWNKWGGWLGGPKLEATGYFHPAKHNGRWWLVDPDGRLFWSHGVDCVRTWDGTPIDEREKWFAELPPQDAAHRELYFKGRAIKMHYSGRSPLSFNFLKWNLMRKYGDDWHRKFTDVTHDRLRAWGVNTIANWSEDRIYLARRTPYVVSVHFGSKAIKGSKGYWGQFKDPFEPEFAANLRRSLARQKGKSAGDPWCIGYFVDNELGWGDEVSLALAALASPADQAAKKEFVADLKKAYGGIEKLNAAWGTSHASWDALSNHQGTPDKKKAWKDLTAFYTRIAEAYFSTVNRVVKEVAPKNLYLGCRFAWVNNRAAKAAAPYCDVVSYNLYRYSVSGFKYPGGDKPVIIGEFHFGALDRGMFHTGLRRAKDQEDRAEKYRAYVRGALSNPQLVGCHWFKYQDEPTTGRTLDGENYQIGFVDIVDTPYPETIEAVKDVGFGMYEFRAGGKR